MNKEANKFIPTFLKGIGMGAANVIPGVSGGTIALITGIYEKLINSLKSFDVQAFKFLIKGRFKDLSAHVNLNFLIAVFLGVGVSIVSLAKLLEYLFENYSVYLWAFFFGLILASVYYVGKTVGKWNWGTVLIFLTGTGVAVAISLVKPPTESDQNRLSFNKNYQDLSYIVDNQLDSIKKYKTDSAYCLSIKQEDSTVYKNDNFSNKSSCIDAGHIWVEPIKKKEFLFLIICGIVAISSMILPGLSGSYVLLLMGKYILILSAITNFNLSVLIPFGIGCIFGLLAFSHLLAWVFKKFKDATISLLTGFILGSLMILWPWKKTLYLKDNLGADDENIIQGYEWLIPDLGGETIMAVLLIFIGIASIWAIEFMGNKIRN